MGTDDRIVIRGTLGDGPSLGHLPTDRSTATLFDSMRDIPLPSTSTIPLPDADDADIIPMPHSDIPKVRPVQPGVPPVIGNFGPGAASVLQVVEPIVVDDTEALSTVVDVTVNDVLDLTGPEPFFNITPGLNYIEIIPIDDAPEGSSNEDSNNKDENADKDAGRSAEEEENVRSPRRDAFGRLGPPVTDINTEDSQALFFAGRDNQRSFDLEDGEQRSDVESPLQACITIYTCRAANSKLTHKVEEWDVPFSKYFFAYLEYSVDTVGGSAP